MQNQKPKEQAQEQLILKLVNEGSGHAQSKQSQKVISEYFEQYQSYLQIPLQLPSDSDLELRFTQNSIKYCQTKDKQKIGYDANQGLYQCFQEKAINNFQMVLFTIKVSVFSLPISLLNIKGRNPFLRMHQSQNGSYGSVYYLSFLGTYYAFKIFLFDKPPGVPSHFIMKAIKEFAIMKICSSFQSGPYLSPIMGFDIVAYDDSVMFCMEKCTDLEHLGNEDVNKLKQNLKIMHKYRLIHYDINPNNIMFSPYFNKPVFIDFGFSSAITEAPGIKTSTIYRGTPAFSSQEMTRLLGNNQNTGCIDVYYNDIYSLQSSINSIRAQLREIPNENDSEQQNLLYEDQIIEDQLLLYLLKHRLFQENKKDIIQTLKCKDYSLFKKYGKDVLQIFKRNKSFQLFDEIYGQINQQFHKYLDPAELQIFIKNYRKQANYQSLIKHQGLSVDFHERVGQAQQKVILRNHEAYKQFLYIKDVFVNSQYIEQSKHILIQCLRFDQKNYNLQQKIIFANMFNLANRLTRQPDIAAVKTSFRWLMQYCLTPPRTAWKKQHIFIVLLQMLMIDADISPYYDPFLSFFCEVAVTFIDKIKYCIQLFKYGYIINFKHIFDPSLQNYSIFSKILTFNRQFWLKTFQSHQKSKQKDVQVIIAAVSESFFSKSDKNNENNYLMRINTILSNLSDSQLRNELSQFLFLQSLIQLQKKSESAFGAFFSIKSFIFSQIYTKKRQIFHYSIFHLVRILLIMKRYKQLSNMLLLIIESIDCQEVSCKFKFQMDIFLISSDNDPDKTFRFVKELLQTKHQFGYMNLQYRLILDRIQNKQFVEKHPQIIDQLSCLFVDLEAGLKLTYVCQKPQNQIEYIMYRQRIVKFFLTTSQKFSSQLFFELVKNIKQNIKAIEFVSSMRHNLLKLEYEIYMCAYYRANRQFQDELLASEKLCDIASIIGYEKANTHFLMRVIRIAQFLRDQEKMNQNVEKYFNLSKSISSYSRYFQVNDRKFIVSIIYTFLKSQRLDNFYDFLTNISKFISRFPCEFYFWQWINSMDYAMKEQQPSKLMKFAILKDKCDSFWDNRYFIIYFMYSLLVEKDMETKKTILIKIAQNLGFLASYARNYLIKGSYEHMMQLFPNMRKRSYLLFNWGYKYLPQLQINEFLKKRIQYDNNIYNKQSLIIQALRSKLKAALLK